MTSEPKPKLKIRDCSDYYQEYKACISLSNRVQTYYAFGYYQNKEDCAHWREKLDLCKSCVKDGNSKAGEALLKMEQEKADEIVRKRATVWTYRDEPPPMWYFPGKLKYDVGANNMSD